MYQLTIPKDSSNFYQAATVEEVKDAFRTYIDKHRAELGISDGKLEDDINFQKLKSRSFYQGVEIQHADELRDVLSSVYLDFNRNGKIVVLFSHTKLTERSTPLIMINLLLCVEYDLPFGDTTNYLNHGNIE